MKELLQLGENTNSETKPEATPEPEVATQNDAENVAKGTINVDSAIIRREPNGEILDSFKRGTEVTILGEKDDWYNISVGEYNNCYIAKRLVKEN